MAARRIIVGLYRRDVLPRTALAARREWRKRFGDGGRVEKFRRDGWGRLWPVGVEMLCYQGQMAGEPAFLRMTRVRMSVEPNRNHLIFFAKSLDECFAVGIKQFLAALLPRCS